LTFDKAACLTQSESVMEGQHEENFLFIDVGTIGIRQLRGTASHGYDDNDHAGSDNNGSSS
jgi:hypothetical protein